MTCRASQTPCSRRRSLGVSQQRHEDDHAGRDRHSGPARVGLRPIGEGKGSHRRSRTPRALRSRRRRARDARRGRAGAGAGVKPEDRARRGKLDQRAGQTPATRPTPRSQPRRWRRRPLPSSVRCSAMRASWRDGSVASESCRLAEGRGVEGRASSYLHATVQRALDEAMPLPRADVGEAHRRSSTRP